MLCLLSLAIDIRHMTSDRVNGQARSTAMSSKLNDAVEVCGM